MVLAAATLASGLANMAPTDSEGSAIQAFVDAWEAYFDQSTVAATQATHGSYPTALSAMAAAMAGCSASGAAAAKIQAATVAFWSALAPLAAVVWQPSVVLVPPAVPPPGLSGIAAALAPVFTSNQGGNLSLSAAANAVAGALHSANAGGTVPGSIPPSPPAPIPIL